MQKNPDRKVAAADVELAQVGSRIARNALLPNLYFSESALRGNDPVYVFGTRLRQNGFAQSDFALNSLNRPTPVNNFVTRLSGNWTAFDSWHSEFEIRRADLLAKSASDGAARSDQEIVHRTVAAYEAILLATRRLEVARHDVKTAQAVQESSKNRVDAGLAVDADALTAAANLAERQQAQIAAEGEVEIAWAELEAATGHAIAPEQRNLQPLEERQFDIAPLADTVANYSRLSAPFAGFVTARHVDPGATATPGVPLMEVEKAGVLELDASVDESLVRVLQKGMSVPVAIAAVGSRPLTGRVREIDPAGDPSSHSFVVKIDLPANSGLRSGMFGTAEIGNGSRALLLVPQSAVVTHGSLNGIWVLDGNRIASLRYVSLGAKHDDNAEVLSGLSAGETVVLAPGDRELGGSRIEVSQ